MTYNLVNNCLTSVRSIVYNNRRIVNPPDSLVIQLGLGYPLVQTAQPEYNPEIQYVTKSYRQESDSIVEVWTVHDIPIDSASNEERNEYSEVIQTIESIESSESDNSLESTRSIGVQDNTNL